jgi:cytochrome bd-type quinol oxidase subunit 2
MPTTKSDNDVDSVKLYKQPFSISQLIMTVLFRTYFLTVLTIELSLSIYVIQENKPEIYHEYLVFKRQAPIWKWWQVFSAIIIPLSIITAVRDLLQTFTKKATNKRNLLDIVTALQLFAVLYTVFTRVLPLENKLIQATSKDNTVELKFFQCIVFILNILGCFITVFRYRDWKNDKRIHPKEKTQ